ncbi:MAG: PHP domain-containing protein [bacterium]|nr:PHP domain-containing protein [bacterium]MDE0500080.1 PHP domain-containing protein [bacterium]
MGVDLHTHTTASDGSDSPAELVSAAAALGLSAVAVTDHDTTEGLAEAEAAASRAGIELVKGLELSLQWGLGAMHLLVLLIEDRDYLSSRLVRVREGRTRRNLKVVELLRSRGMDVTLEEVREEGGSGTIGRPHLASLLVKKGYAPDIPAAFDLYLGRGRPAYVERFRLDPADAIAAAHAAGGVAVLAHPLTLGVEGGRLSAVLEELAEQGLDGMEAHYGAYDPPTRRSLTELARRHGLVPSGGSDYHGRFKPDVKLGTGRGDLLVPDQVLAELRAAVSARRSPTPHRS